MGKPEKVKTSRKRMIVLLSTIGLAVSGVAGYYEGLVFGLTVAAASVLIGAGYMIFSNPPPPRADVANPAGLDFGRRD